MPIYEFECRTCHKKTTALVMVRERAHEVRCRHCNGADLERLWSRFASPKSEDARLEALADPSALGSLNEDDPKAVAQFMKKMGREMGEDFGDDIDQAIDQELSGDDASAGIDAGDDSGDL